MTKAQYNKACHAGPYLPFQNGASRLSTQSVQRPMRVDKGQFYDTNGQLFNLKCANWFGFNNGQTMLDGLWAASTSMVVDFSLVSYRIQVRLLASGHYV